MKLREKLITTTLVVAVLLACVLGGAFVWMDTAAYRHALGEVSAASSRVSGVSANLQSDLEAYARCASMRDESHASNAIYTEEGRACLIAASKSVKTDVGALAFASGAASWLSQHPTDESVRQAALAAIEKGREALAQGKAVDSDLTETLARAHDQSWLLSVAQGKMWKGKSTFDFIADTFDRVEFAIMLPERANLAQQWRLKAYQAKS